MEFTYDICENRASNNGWIRLESTTNLNEINASHVTYPRFVRIYKNDNLGSLHKTLETPDELDNWRIVRERAAVWKNNLSETVTTTISVTAASAVKPIHYKNFVDNYQWLDVMSRIPRYQDSEKFKAAVELQIRKYLDRNGRKDDELQELKKGLFYYMYLVMYLKNDCKPILAKDIHEIMEKFK